MAASYADAAISITASYGIRRTFCVRVMMLIMCHMRPCIKSY